MSLFGRRAVVTVGELRIENLTVRFDVSLDNKNLGKASISIYNLNAEHRQQVEQAGALEVTLLAGYVDQDLALLFRGDMREATSVKDGSEWITTLSTGDGDAAPKARINKSYAPGTDIQTAWNDAVGALTDLGIGAGNALSDFSLADFKEGIAQFLHGGAVQGSALKEVRRIARSANLDISIQDKELIITGIDQPLPTTAVLLSPTTGLIASPQKGVRGELKVRALLIPGLKPRRKVQIESALVSGLYVIKKAKYKGDTSANDWYADLECVEAPQ